MSYTAVTQQDVSLSSTGSWIDIDVSAYVPASATGVVIIVKGSPGANSAFGLRKNGSTDNRTANFGNSAGRTTFIIGVDGSRIFEGQIASTSIDFVLSGYLESEAVFFTNAVNQSITTTAAWTDTDISSDTGGTQQQRQSASGTLADRTTPAFEKMAAPMTAIKTCSRVVE